MIKIIMIFVCFFTLSSAIEIDTKLLQEIIKNDSDALQERVLLAKYYEKQNEDSKALTLLNEVLQKDSKNKSALNIQKLIYKKEQRKEVFKEASLDFPIKPTEAQQRLETYFDTKNYQLYSTLYQALLESDVKLDDTYHIKAAYIYLWDARYKESTKALNKVTQENNIDKAKIRADICYYNGEYQCAVKLYDKLYNSSYNVDYAVKLINSYIYLSQVEKAQRVYKYISRKYPNNTDLKALGKKLSTLKNRDFIDRAQAYDRNKNEETLQSYVNALYAKGDIEKALQVLHDFNLEYATNKSLLLEAKYLIWSGYSQKALDILQEGTLPSELETKLMMGQIYSWQQKFDESKACLDEVLQNSQDASLLYEAKKARAFVYMWERENQLAKNSFEELKKVQANDKEVLEALMELNHDYAGLLRIYKKRVKKSTNSNDIKRLSDLYIANKEPKKALKYLKNYVDENPQNLEATKELALLLIQNKDYYQGFGYLEYYAVQKQDAKSNFLLAQNYYWSGFSKEALEVLNALLKEEPENQKAVKLKADILKISPRFTTSNSGATVGMYHQGLGKKQLEVADSLYFNSHYKASLMYYENYLEDNPTNHDVRYRYAFALENAGKYGKAEGEFALMLWSDDSDEIRYHYAYNLMKNAKLKEAKEIFLNLQKSTYQKISPNLNTFLKVWKKDWESLSYRKYAQNYDVEITKNQLWAYKKQAIFSSVNFISVGVYDPVYKQLDNNNSYRVKFYQEYATNTKSDSGYKTLDLKCDTNQTECKIIKESWKQGKYKKSFILAPLIEQRLKDIAIYEKNPLALAKPSKKKNTASTTVTNYHDIVLNKEVKKEPIKKSSLILSEPSIASKLNYLLAKAYYFEDSDGIVFKSLDLLYKRDQLIEDLDFGVDLGLFALEQKNVKNNQNVKKYNGIRYGVSLYYNHFSLRLGMNDYDDFSEFVPTIKYENRYENHSYALEYTHQNALFYTYSLAAYEKKITAEHFSVTDYISFENSANLWANLQFNAFSNGDFETTGQYDWRFFYDTLFLSNFTYDLALEGWYTSHTKEHSDFYSPDFYDATLVRFDPQYMFSRYLGVRAQLGIGYSIMGEDIPYKYGLWIFGAPNIDLSYTAGCLKSNTAKTAGGAGYNYLECGGNLEYKW